MLKSSALIVRGFAFSSLLSKIQLVQPAARRAIKAPPSKTSHVSLEILFNPLIHPQNGSISNNHYYLSAKYKLNQVDQSPACNIKKMFACRIISYGVERKTM